MLVVAEAGGEMFILKVAKRVDTATPRISGRNPKVIRALRFFRGDNKEDKTTACSAINLALLSNTRPWPKSSRSHTALTNRPAGLFEA